MAKKKEDIKSSSPELDLYEKAVATIPGVELKGDKFPYTSINGNMFSILGEEGLVGLRLAEKEREDIIKKYKTKLREAYGIVQKEYVVVPAKLLENTKEFSKYFRLSYEYAKSLKAKPPKRKS